MCRCTAPCVHLRAFLFSPVFAVNKHKLSGLFALYTIYTNTHTHRDKLRAETVQKSALKPTYTRKHSTDKHIWSSEAQTSLEGHKEFFARAHTLIFPWALIHVHTTGLKYIMSYSEGNKSWLLIMGAEEYAWFVLCLLEMIWYSKR